MRIETLAVHAGHDIDPATAAVTPPIHLSTTFAREADGSYRAGFLYSRYTNPNRAALERCLAELEGGAAAAAFSSGSAATMTLHPGVGPGAHVIVPDDAYFGTIKLARDVFGPWGIELSLVDMTDIANVQRRDAPNTKLVWIETPSNPLLRVVDIAAVADDRASRWRALRRRQHVGHARAAAAARARRRRLDALDDEIPRRTQRRVERRARRPRRIGDLVAADQRRSR